MDEKSKNILEMVGIEFNIQEQLVEDQLILRDPLLDAMVYNSIKKQFPELKQIFSSSLLTSLHKEAGKTQKWPLLNLVRQILHGYKYEMKPIRKSDGYTPEGVKKYKRFFEIVISQSVSNASAHSDVHYVEMTI